MTKGCNANHRFVPAWRQRHGHSSAAHRIKKRVCSNPVVLLLLGNLKRKSRAQPLQIAPKFLGLGIADFAASRSLKSMTTSKRPPFCHGLIPGFHHSTTLRTDLEPGPSVLQLPLVPTEAEGEQPASIHYADNAQGLLAHGDPELLRRFILNSKDAAEQHRRQMELFVESTTCLAFSASGCSVDAVGPPRIVQTRLYAWPVAICMAKNLRVRSHFHFDVAQSTGLKAELAHEWARALNIAAADVAIHGAVDVRHLVGITPLKLRAFMRSFARHNALQASRCEDRDELRSKPTTDDDPWAVLLPSQTELLTSVAQNRPVSFLLTAFVSWDCGQSAPVWPNPPGHKAQRMRSLLEALFTHALPSPNGPSAFERQARIQPQVRLGHPQPLLEAVTQAQWMQLAWMAEHARNIDCSFRFDHGRDGNILNWSATLTDEFESEIARVFYCYDGFWRPENHIQTVTDQVSLAQATGQMRTDSPPRAMPH